MGLQRKKDYDSFLSFTGWLSMLFYAGPAAIITILMNYFDVRSEYVMQFLLVYLIAAVARILGEGLMGITVQIAASTDDLMNTQEKAKDKI